MAAPARLELAPPESESDILPIRRKGFIGDLTGSRTHDFEDENLMSYPLDDETMLVTRGTATCGGGFLMTMAASAGLEPATLTLTGCRSTN